MPERETKLHAGPDFSLPELGGPDDGFLAEPQPVRRYRTTYWDTPDLRLARWGASLRYRDDEGWTVKLPGGRDGALLVRDEHTFEGGPRSVPAGARALLTGFLRTARPEPVARSRTVRKPLLLRDAAGATLAEVVDDQVEVLDGDKVAGGYRELEVELGPDAQPDTLDTALARLRAAGAEVPDEQPSKYRRALGDRGGDLGPDELAVPDPGAKPTVEALLRSDLAASARRLLSHLPAVVTDDDPEAIHQARVGTRRIRSTLRTVRKLLEPDWNERLRSELKWLADLLGEVRDADVLEGRLERRVAALPEGDQAAGRRLWAHLAGQRADAHAALLDALAGPRAARLLDDVIAAVQAPALTERADEPAAEVLPALVAKDHKKLRKRIRKAGQDPDDGTLHKIRIRAKRTRYAAEAATPVAGKPARRLAKAAEDLQDLIGDQHDAVMAEGWLRETADQARRPTLVPAGELIAAERAAAAQGRATWRSAAARTTGKKATSWLP